MVFPVMMIQGQWAIFNMIGFYPDCPGLPEYTLTTPVFNKVTIRLDPKWYKEKELVIESNRTQPGTLYINKVLLNGKKFNQYRITHDELVHSQRILFHRYRFWVDRAVGLFRVRQPIFYYIYIDCCSR